MTLELPHVPKVKVGNAKVFRPEGWEVVLIASEEIKDALEHMGATAHQQWLRVAKAHR